MEPIDISPGKLWVPVYTKPRCEKVVEEYCRRYDIPAYLPLLRRAKRYQRRTVETFLPMFRGYLFAQLDADRRSQIVRSHKIVSILQVTEIQEHTLVRELNDIRLLEAIQQESELVVHPELAAGMPVRVISGPLAGTTGIVERRNNLTRVTVNVEMLGQSVSAEMDVGEVEAEEN